MHHRQQIREQLGILEERLEELGALASANERNSLAADSPQSFGTEILLQNALDSMRDLNQLVHEQQLFKSVSAPEFLSRVSSLLIQDAAAQGLEVAIAHHGEGKISMEMAELVMGAILAGLRASLRSQKGFTRAARLKKHLFPTASVYLEVKADSSEILFRLIDDSQGYGATAGTERQFQRLREHIARSGGWFSQKSFADHGGMIEFKVPLAHNRTEVLVLREGSFELLVPSACVAEICQGNAAGRVPPGTAVLRPHAEKGLAPGDSAAPVLLRVGVADLQFWVGCEAIVTRARARRISAEDFVESGAWLRVFGSFQQDGVARLLPMLEGNSLAQFQLVSGGEA